MGLGSDLGNQAQTYQDRDSRDKDLDLVRGHAQEKIKVHNRGAKTQMAITI